MVKLYHGSDVQDITILKPKMRHIRKGEQKAPRIYASSNPGIASLFILDWHDEVARLGRESALHPWTFRILDSDRVQDRPGSLYELDATKFTHIQGGVDEYFATTPIRVLREMIIESPLSFAKRLGINIEYA